MVDAPPAKPAVALADALTSLASPVRLALLRELRTPKTLKEIVVRSEEGAQGHADRERVLARQTVKEHLDRLLQAGIITVREGERDYGPAVEYVVNHRTIFALSEELRDLARLRPTQDPEGATIRSPQAVEGSRIRAPCLVLVKGLEEGRTFSLEPPAQGRRAWTIGRQRGLDVCLDFDPFISSENALVQWEDGSYYVKDLPESSNGTALNFQALPKEGRQGLRTGDLIGVGRSLLMFKS